MDHKFNLRRIIYTLLVATLLAACGPSKAESFVNSGLAHSEKGNYDQAIAEYDKAIALDPELVSAYNNRGLAYSEKGDYDRAIANYGEAISINPQDTEAFYNRGYAYADKGDFDRAIADFDQAIALDPQDARPYFLRGLVYAEIGEQEKAISDLERALDLGLEPDIKQFVEQFLVNSQDLRPAVGEEVEIHSDYDRHIDEGTNPGPYPSNPPAGGRHYGNTLEAGFYDENSVQAQVAFPEGNMMHNLEHGYVIFWYNCAELNEGDCSTLKSEIKSVMDDFNGLKLIAFPWPALDIPIAMTSWGRLQRFETFDLVSAAEFINTNRNQAPEPNAP